MEKIGLITLHKDNFGSILQCYATKYAIEELGYKCDVLYEIDNNKFGKIAKKIVGFLKLIGGYLFDQEYVISRKKIKSTPQSLSDCTRRKMDEFVEEVLYPRGYTFRELCRIEKEYIAFVVGSDQVWNAFNTIPRAYFLKFTANSKKIAFAASFGTDKPDKTFKKKIRDGLSGFDDISVREESGVDIVKEISSDIPVVRIADPTIMLDANYWRVFCQNEKVGQNYVLVHFLNNPNDIAVDKIEQIRKEYGLEVVCIGYKYDLFSKYPWGFFDCSPREYVAYINGASYICTDSFHTALFSINLGKEFYVFDRQYLHSHPQTSRISELLVRYNLNDRFINDNEKEKTISVVTNESLIFQERELTRSYLINTINDKIPLEIKI